MKNLGAICLGAAGILGIGMGLGILIAHKAKGGRR